MKTLTMRALALAMLLGLMLAGGCASVPPGPQTFIIANGVTCDELATQLRAGRPEAELLAAIRSRGMHHAPQAPELESLQAAGASQDLIDAVLIASWQPGGSTAGRYAYSGYPGYYASPGVGVGLGWWGYRRHGPTGSGHIHVVPRGSHGSHGSHGSRGSRGRR